MRLLFRAVLFVQIAFFAYSTILCAQANDEGNADSCRKLLLDGLAEAREVKKNLSTYTTGRFGYDLWPIDGRRPFEPYDQTFSVLLNKSGFSDLIRKRKFSGRTAHVLDLFGSGVFLEGDSPVDSVTGVRIFHNIEYPGPDENLKSRWGVVLGDLFQVSTWEKIRKNMEQRHIPTQDIIVIRPMGGTLAVDPRTIGFHNNFMIMLRRAYRILSVDHGELYIQISQLSITPEHTPLFQKWVELLNKQGISSDFDANRGVVRIVKSRSSPKNLPVPDSNTIRQFKWEAPKPRDLETIQE